MQWDEEGETMAKEKGQLSNEAKISASGFIDNSCGYANCYK